VPEGGSFGEISDGDQGIGPLMWHIRDDVLLTATSSNLTDGTPDLPEKPEADDRLYSKNSVIFKSIVVIKGSFVEGRDVYATPISQMPGALIWLNAIYTSFIYKGEIYSKNITGEIICVVIFSFVITWLFFNLPKKIATTLSTWIFIIAIGFGFICFGQFG